MKLTCLIFFLSIVGCTPKTAIEKPVEPVEVQPPKTPEISNPAVQLPTEPPLKEFEAPVQQQGWIATLKSSTNRVDFKSKTESIWQSATADMNFFKFDSLQTHQQSTAVIRYLSSSELDVKEKTLLVFDEDPGVKKKKSDRVILKTGELLGKTNTELWVLTDSGLVQISASAKSKVAKARVQVKNEQFKVVVDQGTAVVTVKNHNDEIQKIFVTQNNSLDLDTKKQIRPLIATGEDPQKYVETIEKPTEQKVTLENVNETEMTKKNVYLLNGKLSAVGAKILVNGDVQPINDDLSFTKSINLTKGSNLIVIQVIKSDSTTQFIRKKVVLED